MAEVYYFGDPKLKPKIGNTEWFRLPVQDENNPMTGTKEKFCRVEIFKGTLD